jgi:hypothetical protein
MDQVKLEYGFLRVFSVPPGSHQTTIAPRSSITTPHRSIMFLNRQHITSQNSFFLHLGLQICIQEVLASNLGMDTSYPDWGFSWFSSVPTGIYLDNTSIRSQPFPSKSFPTHYSSVVILTDSILLDIEKASFNVQKKNNFITSLLFIFGTSTLTPVLAGH